MANEKNLITYIEGVFTPIPTFAGAAVGLTTDVLNGRYTRIGDTIHANFRVRFTAKGTSVGQLRIDGMPFVLEPTTRPICSVLGGGGFYIGLFTSISN